MTLGPGPEERKLSSRLIFRLTGRWPQSVVDERLGRSNVDAALRELDTHLSTFQRNLRRVARHD